MNNILAQIHNNCPIFSDDVYGSLHQVTRTLDGDTQIMLKGFKDSIADEELQGKFSKLWESLNEAQSERDIILVRELITKGMSISLQMAVEILSSKI